MESAISNDAKRVAIIVSLFVCYPPMEWTTYESFYGRSKEDATELGQLDPLGPMNNEFGPDRVLMGNAKNFRVHRFRPIYMALQREYRHPDTQCVIHDCGFVARAG